ncbi:monovalent cation/H+ antiporter complex subunit F [Ostreibacterium oceani]|uniref:Cation:proton antiporter n=1 Tax=Ostreibacterium oceani TaxID=2654998 RepID=A0A6N7EVD3_9GAMM|nr:monovalent cation/H+ antiporter complex subunit F [Ostreibacterium oceani]MPV86511.1 cation:proton antiporter [Ostreibacterium oceani]
MSWFDIVLLSALIVLSFSIILVFVRIVIGPSLPDRVISFDLIGTIMIGMIAIYSMSTGVHAYMDAAIILSLVLFLGSVAFAYYMKKDHK